MLTTFKFVYLVSCSCHSPSPLSTCSCHSPSPLCPLPGRRIRRRYRRCSLQNVPQRRPSRDTRRRTNDDDTVSSTLVRMGATGVASSDQSRTGCCILCKSPHWLHRQGSKLRFCLDNAASVFNAAFDLDTNMWPDDCDQLSRHGNQKVASAAIHYDSLLRGWHKDELVGVAGAEGVCSDKLQ